MKGLLQDVDLRSLITLLQLHVNEITSEETSAEVLSFPIDETSRNEHSRTSSICQGDAQIRQALHEPNLRKMKS